MKNFLTGIFKETGADYSMMRFVTFICLFLVIILTVCIIYLSALAHPLIIGIAPSQTVIPAETRVIDTLIYFALGLLTIGTGAKAFQKFAERENNSEGRPQS